MLQLYGKRLLIYFFEKSYTKALVHLEYRSNDFWRLLFIYNHIVLKIPKKAKTDIYFLDPEKSEKEEKDEK